MKFKIELENIEEYGMGGPYAGTCYVVSEDGSRYLLTPMVLQNHWQISATIFIIPILKSEATTESGNYVLVRTIQLGIANMLTMEFSILEKEYPYVIDVKKLDSNKLIIRYKDFYSKEFVNEIDFTSSNIVSVKKIIDTNILFCIPKNKFDTTATENLKGKSYAALKSIIPELLSWLQDINWPVATPIANHLSTMLPDILEELKPILLSADAVWKYHILDAFFIKTKSQHYIKIKELIEQLAFLPTVLEQKEEVDVLAKEVLQNNNNKYFY